MSTDPLLVTATQAVVVDVLEDKSLFEETKLIRQCMQQQVVLQQDTAESATVLSRQGCCIMWLLILLIVITYFKPSAR